MVRKVLSQRGASMIIALLFLLVAMMVSVVMLTAGVTTAHRVADDRVREQSRASVTSAARVARSLLSESSVTVSWDGTDDGNGDYEWSDPEVSGDGRFGEMLSFLVQDVLDDPLVTGASPVTIDLNVAVDGGDDRLSGCHLYLEAYPTDTPDIELFDVDVMVRGRLVDEEENCVLSMPATRLVGNVVEGTGTRHCNVAWVDETQVRFVAEGS